MLENLVLNRVFCGAVGLAAIYFGMIGFLDPVAVIVGLNGLFVGCMVAVVVSYHQLIIGATLGIGEYNRVRQMTLGFAVIWGAVCVGAANSIYLRSIGVDVPATALTIAQRYLSIIAAVLQVTAPDFGLGLFYGRDRRILWTGATLGFVAAVITVFMQWRGLYF